MLGTLHDTQSNVRCSSVCVECMWQLNRRGRCALLLLKLGVDRLSAPILSIFPIIDIGHFQNRFADIFFYYYYYANKHTIYRWHYLLVNKLYRWNNLIFKCTIWLDAACLSSTLCGRNTQSNLRPPLIWYVGSHESDQSTRKTEGSLKPKAHANWSCLSDHASVVSQM